LLASCAPVNNITKDKNDKKDSVQSNEILLQSNKEKEKVISIEKKIEKKHTLVLYDIFYLH